MKVINVDVEAVLKLRFNILQCNAAPAIHRAIYGNISRQLTQIIL